MLSAIVTLFNRERYIGEALESVLAQTEPPDEIVVVDDGSRDASAEVVRSSFGERLRLISQANQGPAVARNTGLAATHGDVVAFLDCDDLWEPRKLELQHAALKAQPGLDLVFCRMSPFLSPEIGEDELPAIDPALREAFMASGMMARRTAFDRIGKFDGTLCGPEVTDWISRAAQAGLHLKVLPEVLMRRRVHHGNMMRSNSAKRDFVRMLKRRLDEKRASAS